MAQAGALVHLDADLSDEDIAALYRASDVLVHPYRGEGFAMPVLEAMASGLPVIHTAGGPTDEFCPPQAGWRIRSRREALPGGRVDRFETAGEPWMLEPDVDHLAELLREAAEAGAEERERRGALGRSAALHFGWDRVAALYAERAAALAARAPRPLAAERELDGAPAVLATPAWRGDDDLPALLRAWTQAPAAACLYLLADPATDGEPAELEAHVMAAAAGIDLDACPDIAILREHAVPGRDAALHAAAELYVPLHDACAGHVRAGRRQGCDAGRAGHPAGRPARHPRGLTSSRRRLPAWASPCSIPPPRWPACAVAWARPSTRSSIAASSSSGRRSGPSSRSSPRTCASSTRSGWPTAPRR